MLNYCLKRLVQALPLLLIVTMITFCLIQLAPYDAVDSFVTPSMSNETIALIKEQQGLNQPVIIQYFYWLKNILHGDFGYSLIGHQNIGQALAEKIPNTISLVLPAYVTALIAAIFLGLYAGAHAEEKKGKLIDQLCSIGISTPTFWLAMLLIYFFGYRWDLLPIIGMGTAGQAKDLGDFLQHFILPYVVLVIAFIPDLTRYIRALTIKELQADYILVQRAFGASQRTLLWHHLFKNILRPIFVQIGFFFPTLITGAVITESIFSWPGVGNFFLTAAKALDYPIILAIVLLSSVMVILGNLLADLAVMLVDPRIKEER